VLVGCHSRGCCLYELTDKNIRRGSFLTVPDLIAGIEDYLRVTNTNPKPLTRTAEAILQKVRRGKGRSAAAVAPWVILLGRRDRRMWRAAVSQGGCPCTADDRRKGRVLLPSTSNV
jgi:hypothetical protein